MSAATPALQVRALTRRFGDFTAVKNVSFRVEHGEICGFIGPNGAGKTTTMRICATLDLPDKGEVWVNGRSALDAPREVRHELGFMPDAYGAYTNVTVADYLEFFARAYGLRSERRATIARLVEFTSLEGLLEKPTTSLSKGMKQRLCLAKTLLHDPALLILDEPAAGLDPRARIELRELVRALAKQGKAVLISSHILSELGEMCDSVVVVEEGRVRAADRVENIKADMRAGAQTRVFVRCLEGAEVLERMLLEEPGVLAPHREREGVVFGLEGGEAGLARLIEVLVRRGAKPIEIRPENVDLEDVFLSLTEGRVQ